LAEFKQNIICSQAHYLESIKQAPSGACLMLLLVLNGGAEGVKLELLLQQFVIKLKSEEMLQIIYAIDYYK